MADEEQKYSQVEGVAAVARFPKDQAAADLQALAAELDTFNQKITASIALQEQWGAAAEQNVGRVAALMQQMVASASAMGGIEMPALAGGMPEQAWSDATLQAYVQRQQAEIQQYVAASNAGIEQSNQNMLAAQQRAWATTAAKVVEIEDLTAAKVEAIRAKTAQADEKNQAQILATRQRTMAQILALEESTSRQSQGSSFFSGAGKLAMGGLGLGAVVETAQLVNEGLVKVQQGMAGVEQVLPQLERDQQAYNQATRDFISTAHEYAAGVEQVLEAAKTWGRQYHDLGIVEEAVHQATIVSVADNVALEQVVKSNEATMAGFGVRLHDVADAQVRLGQMTDVTTVISHNAQIAATDLLAALEKSASSAGQAGFSYEALTGVIATMARNTGESGAVIGNALKSVFTTMETSSKARTELEQANIALTKMGDDGQAHLRPLQDVLISMAIKTEGATYSVAELEKAASGGRFQVNRLAATLIDGGDIFRNWALAVEASGKAEDLASVQVQTLHGRLQQLHDTLVGLVADGANQTGLSKFLADAAHDVDTFARGLAQIPAEAIKTTVEIAALVVVLQKGWQMYQAITTAVEVYKAAQEAVSVATAMVTSTTTAATEALAAEALATQAVAAAEAEAAIATAAATAGLSLLAAGLAAVIFHMGKAADEQERLNNAMKQAQVQALREADQHQQRAQLLQSIAEHMGEVEQALQQTNLTQEKRAQLLDTLKGMEEALAMTEGQSALESVKASSDKKAAVEALAKVEHDRAIQQLRDEKAMVEAKLASATTDMIEAQRAQADLESRQGHLQDTATNVYDREGAARFMQQKDALDKSVEAVGKQKDAAIAAAKQLQQYKGDIDNALTQLLNPNVTPTPAPPGSSGSLAESVTDPFTKQDLPAAVQKATDALTAFKAQETAITDAANIAKAALGGQKDQVKSLGMQIAELQQQQVLLDGTSGRPGELAQLKGLQEELQAAHDAAAAKFAAARAAFEQANQALEGMDSTAAKDQRKLVQDLQQGAEAAKREYDQTTTSLKQVTDELNRQTVAATENAAKLKALQEQLQVAQVQQMDQVAKSIESGYKSISDVISAQMKSDPYNLDLLRQKIGYVGGELSQAQVNADQFAAKLDTLEHSAGASADAIQAAALATNYWRTQAANLRAELDQLQGKSMADALIGPADRDLNALKSQERIFQDLHKGWEKDPGQNQAVQTLMQGQIGLLQGEVGKLQGLLKQLQDQHADSGVIDAVTGILQKKQEELASAQAALTGAQNSLSTALEEMIRKTEELKRAQDEARLKQTYEGDAAAAQGAADALTHYLNAAHGAADVGQALQAVTGAVGDTIEGWKGAEEAVKDYYAQVIAGIDNELQALDQERKAYDAGYQREKLQDAVEQAQKGVTDAQRKVVLQRNVLTGVIEEVVDQPAVDAATKKLQDAQDALTKFDTDQKFEARRLELENQKRYYQDQQKNLEDAIRTRQASRQTEYDNAKTALNTFWTGYLSTDNLHQLALQAQNQGSANTIFSAWQGLYDKLKGLEPSFAGLKLAPGMGAALPDVTKGSLVQLAPSLSVPSVSVGSSGSAAGAGAGGVQQKVVHIENLITSRPMDETIDWVTRNSAE